MNKHILVTGGAGFIGSHVTDLLIERGYRVTVFDNESTGKRADVNPQATFVYGDVRDEAALEAVFKTGINLNVNTLGTINIIKQCIAHRVGRLLFASSMTIYGTPDVAPTPETAFPAPVSYYGVTKYAAERFAHITATRKDLDFDFNVTSFRMFNVYGERQSLTNAYQGVFAIFMGNVLRGEPINIHSDGEQSRDFVHVSDVARAWVDALDNPKTYGEVINIGTGRPISVNRLCDMVLDAFGYSRQTYTVNHHPAQPGDIRVSSADITKAYTLLGWQPTIAFEDGMKETIIWAKGVMQKS